MSGNEKAQFFLTILSFVSLIVFLNVGIAWQWALLPLLVAFMVWCGK